MVHPGRSRLGQDALAYNCPHCTHFCPRCTNFSHPLWFPLLLRTNLLSQMERYNWHPQLAYVQLWVWCFIVMYRLRIMISERLGAHKLVNTLLKVPSSTTLPKSPVWDLVLVWSLMSIKTHAYKPMKDDKLKWVSLNTALSKNNLSKKNCMTW